MEKSKTTDKNTAPAQDTEQGRELSPQKPAAETSGKQPAESAAAKPAAANTAAEKAAAKPAAAKPAAAKPAATEASTTAESAKPAATEASTTAESAKPTESSKPAELAKTAQKAEIAKPAKPAEPAKPAKPAIVPNPMDHQKQHADVSLISSDDQYYFNEGSHYRLYRQLGARTMIHDGMHGTYFAVWAPNATEVYVMGDFNDWNRESHPLYCKGSSGIWENFIPGVQKGNLYKYYIVSRYNDYRVEKADPFGVYHEVPPKTASVVWDLEYTWNDDEWMKTRKEKQSLDQPMSVYEVHLGSWMRVPEEGARFMTYRELAPKLAAYVKDMGFTHIEFMPIMEHPFYGSWGYQLTGFFAPTSRYGTPQDFMFLVDTLHQQGIGVILDWVPSHFPVDQHGLGVFDGTHLFEHTYPQKGWHPDWNSFIFNYGRHEVRSFLMSSAFYWLDHYHIDGFRVDAVASMLYLYYSRNEGEWMPNEYGGRENIEAISFLRRFNEDIFKNYPDVQTIAEESTDWSMVSRPTYVGGLGFGMKWDMGWMHDTLTYIAHDPIYRKYHHNEMTFRMIYAFTENFLLPLSHDEVVHGKGSLLSKMPGDLWQKFANLRLLLGYMYVQPGKKLLFMGIEIGQWREWYHEESLDWHLLQFAPHEGLQQWVRDLNMFYRNEPSMYECDVDSQGFRWIDCHDWESSTFSMVRCGKSKEEAIIAICNFTPVPRHEYRVGVPFDTFWQEVLNSDAKEYEGSGQGNLGGVEAEPIPFHGYAQSINVNVPPLGIVFFKGECADCEDW
jgi:1,4-alpha-glucan branching enzyme